MMVVAPLLLMVSANFHGSLDVCFLFGALLCHGLVAEGMHIGDGTTILAPNILTAHYFFSFDQDTNIVFRG